MAPTISFFNNKGGVGKTTLVFNVAWMLSELGHSVLAVDLDPQSNLTASFLDEESVERLWPDSGDRLSVYGAIAPLIDGVGDIEPCHIEAIDTRLSLLPGDLKLSAIEQDLATQWPDCLDGKERAFRVISAFGRVIARAATDVQPDYILVDVGPNLGAINRAAMDPSDGVVLPLGPDLYSLQGLRNLGPQLREWRQGWEQRLQKNPRPELELPSGAMRPLGYVILQHAIRVNRVVGAYDRWVKRVPSEYRRSVLGDKEGKVPISVKDGPNCVGLVKHYQSLIPMAQEARKPIFALRSADGAIGAHQRAVRAAHGHFKDLATSIAERATPVS